MDVRRRLEIYMVSRQPADPPRSFEANWIPTSDKRPLPAIRLYGPTDAFNSDTFKLPDFEFVG